MSSRFTSDISRTPSTGVSEGMFGDNELLGFGQSLNATGTLLSNVCNLHLTFKRRNVRDPRALAEIFERAEAQLAAKQHPDPYIR
jgi:hypothetical protein